MKLAKKLIGPAEKLMKLVRHPVSARRFVIAFVATFGGLFAFWTLLVFLVDPYMYYHQGWGLKNVYSNSGARIPGVLRNFEYDTVLFGSSMCQNFKCSEIDEALHAKSVKATSPGLASERLSLYLETAFLYRRNKLSRCVIGVDIFCFAKKSENANYLYLYEDRLFPCEYFYSVDTAEAIADVLITNISAPFNRISQHQLNRDLMFSNKPRFNYGLKEVEDDVRNLENAPNMPDDRTAENFYKHLFVHAKNHPEIQFDLFLPAYNIYFWCLLRAQGKLDAYLKLRNVFARMAAEYPNVRLHDFQAEFDIVCSFDEYKDVTHYSPKINTIIINDIGKGKKVFTLDEFGKRTEAIRVRSAEFQPAFDKLRQEAR